MSEASLFLQALEIMMMILGVSLLLCFVRLHRGPDLPNRTVAFDLIAVHAVGIIVLFAARYGARVLMDAATITAVLGFLGTMVFARFLEEATPAARNVRQSPPDEEL
jgi:multicomponent Na+:H+ antiporter subunit F